VPATIITRIQTGGYDRWRPLFDQDVPRARELATGVRVLRGAEDPDHVFIVLEFASVEAARAWYESPGYQAAIPLRQAAADANVVIVSGFEMPGA
jgi:hypothetical protein